MKKILLAIFVSMLFITNNVMAMESKSNIVEGINDNLNNTVEENVLISQTVKYFKTTASNNSSMLYPLGKSTYYTEEITKEE